MNSKIRFALACVSTLGLAVACAKGDTHNNASIKQLKQEQVIGLGLKDSFPGYDPMDADNIGLATRLLGATLTASDQQAKTDKLDAALKFNVRMLLTNPDIQISASGVATEKLTETIDLDKAADGSTAPGYAVQARCLNTSGCNQVLVLLVEEVPAGTDTSGAPAAVPAAAPSGTSFDSTTSLDAVTAGSGTDTIPVAGGSGSVTIPQGVFQKKQAKVAMLFARQSGGPYALAWSASSTIGNFVNGGTKKSVEQAAADRANGGKAAPVTAPAAQPAATQPAAPQPAASAPVTTVPAGSNTSAAPATAPAAPAVDPSAPAIPADDPSAAD